MASKLSRDTITPSASRKSLLSPRVAAFNERRGYLASRSLGGLAAEESFASFTPSSSLQAADLYTVSVHRAYVISVGRATDLIE